MQNKKGSMLDLPLHLSILCLRLFIVIRNNYYLLSISLSLSPSILQLDK